MNLKNKMLDEWLKKPPAKAFKFKKEDYYSRYKVVADYLDREVHKHVVPLNMLKDDGYLTDHGPDHIKKVIEKASELIENTKIDLSAYEVFILLLSIQFHDVANIFGRKKHARNSKKVIEEVQKVGDIEEEGKIIWDIARSHSGEDGKEDTISDLPELPEDFKNNEIRMRLLASILRLSDELADDSTRSSRYLIKKGLVPKKSQIYHQYARSLHSVKVDHHSKQLKLNFTLDTENSTSKYVLKNRNKYLLDYIFQRVVKTYLECLYCMKFMREYVYISRLNVKIKFYQSLKELHPTIGFEIKEDGYPAYDKKNILDFCPELKNKSGRAKWTGEKVSSYISRKKK